MEKEKTIYLGPYSIKLKCKYDFLPGSPGCMYKRNGDPGNPPEPAEVHLTEVDLGGLDVTGCLSAKHLREIETQIEEGEAITWGI
jgi:hypothetical protein